MAVSLKALIKEILPAGVTQRISNLRGRRLEQYLGRLSIQEAFDEVYKRDFWKRGDSRSGPGSEGLTARRYVELVLEYASKHSLRTVVDAGCGDFSVGSRLSTIFERYIALDVSPRIIEINKQRYADLATKNVTFGVADLTSTTFPEADLILIRQVLQHLTNAQIEQILKNLEASKWRRTLITEEVFDPHNNPTPNLDLPSHTFGTRVAHGSGVYVDKLPFNRPAKPIAIIQDTAVRGGLQSALLIFELSRETAYEQRAFARAASEMR
jgi:SAM-dependent methyltransferase